MIEIIGFLISLVALIILSFKKQPQNRQSSADSSSFEEEEEWDPHDPIQAFLKDLNERAKKQTPLNKPQSRPPAALPSRPKNTLPPPPKRKMPPTQLESYQLRSSLEERRLRSQLEERRLANLHEERKVQTANDQDLDWDGKDHEQSIASHLLKRLPSQKDLILYHEILGKPKSLQ